MTKKLEIVAVKTNKNIYFSLKKELQSSYNYYSNDIRGYLFNDRQPIESFTRGWYYLNETDITSVKKILPKETVNHRYVLKNKAIQSEAIPLVLIKSEVEKYDSDEETTYWVHPYSDMRPLYELEWDELPERVEDVEFDVDVVYSVDVDAIIKPERINIDQWNSSSHQNMSRPQEPQHELLSKIIFPPILEPLTPCKYTSKQVYDMVREFVKKNHNREFCEISSDYDFCFQVNKKIPLADPHSWQKELLKANGKSYKPKKFETRYTGSRTVKLFEMTHSENKYKGYTIIPEMFAENEQELLDKMDALCNEILQKINEPLVDCPVCRGCGVVIKDEKAV